MLPTSVKERPAGERTLGMGFVLQPVHEAGRLFAPQSRVALGDEAILKRLDEALVLVAVDEDGGWTVGI